MSTDMFGPAMLGVTAGIQAFQSMLPRLTDIRKETVHNESFAADVRLGEVAGITLTVGIGIIASSLTQSAVPVYTAIVMSIILVVIYESTLRADRPFENSRHLFVVPREA